MSEAPKTRSVRVTVTEEPLKTRTVRLTVTEEPLKTRTVRLTVTEETISVPIHYMRLPDRPLLAGKGTSRSKE